MESLYRFDLNVYKARSSRTRRMWLVYIGGRVPVTVGSKSPKGYVRRKSNFKGDRDFLSVESTALKGEAGQYLKVRDRADGCRKAMRMEGTSKQSGALSAGPAVNARAMLAESPGDRKFRMTHKVPFVQRLSFMRLGDPWRA